MAIKQFHQYASIPISVFEQLVTIDQKVMDFPWRKEQWESYLQEQIDWMILTLENDELIQGFILFELSEDKWSHLLKIGVSSEFKRQGIARALMSESLSKLKKDFDSCSLEVREGNLSAISLYEKFHFKPVHHMKNYYSDGSHAIKMLAALR